MWRARLRYSARSCQAVASVWNILAKHHYRKPGDHRRLQRKTAELASDNQLVMEFLARHNLQDQSANLLYPQHRIKKEF